MVIAADFQNHTVTAGGTNLYNYVDVPTSVWWALDPGDTVVQVTGGSTWTINWRDTWL